MRPRRERTDLMTKQNKLSDDLVSRRNKCPTIAFVIFSTISCTCVCIQIFNVSDILVQLKTVSLIVFHSHSLKDLYKEATCNDIFCLFICSLSKYETFSYFAQSISYKEFCWRQKSSSCGKLSRVLNNNKTKDILVKYIVLTEIVY